MSILEEKHKQALQDEVRRHHADFSPEQLVRYFIEHYPGRLVMASSMAAEDQVLTDMIVKIDPTVPILTLDTGRLPQETHDLIDATRKKYGIPIRILFPDYTQVESIMAKYGSNLFFESIEKRKLCCHIRKIEPLKRGLAGHDAWFTGLRRQQSVTRAGLAPVAWDEQFGLIKVSPLLDWSTEQVWQYIRENDVPYNALHDQGYPSIGCESCSRPVSPGDDLRAGRWWWEQPEHKECGLHWNKPPENGKEHK